MRALFSKRPTRPPKRWLLALEPARMVTSALLWLIKEFPPLRLATKPPTLYSLPCLSFDMIVPVKELLVIWVFVALTTSPATLEAFPTTDTLPWTERSVI